MCRMYIYQDLLLVFPLSLFILYPNSATKLARQRYHCLFFILLVPANGSPVAMQPLNRSLLPHHNCRPSASLLNSTVIASMLGQVRAEHAARCGLN